MADNFPATAGSGRYVATDQVSYSGDNADVQIVRVARVTGSEGSKTVVEEPAGAGNVDSGTPRMTLATDDAAIALLLGRIGEVQASPTSNTLLDRLKAILTGPVPVSDNSGSLTVDGTVELGATSLSALETITVAQVTAAIPAGTNLIGKVGIDQTTPGTTNGVQLAAAIPAGTNNIGDVDVVTQIGAANIANSQATADTTVGGVELVAARATRRSVTFVQLGTTDVYVGTGTVSTSNGFLLVGTKGAALTLNTTAAVKGIVGSGSQAVGVLEEYD